MCPGIVDGVAKCEDPDQTATLGAGWSWSALFAQICMSKSIDHHGTHIWWLNFCYQFFYGLE